MVDKRKFQEIVLKWIITLTKFNQSQHDGADRRSC